MQSPFIKMAGKLSINIKKTFFKRPKLGFMWDKLYFCTVFFIVLDLRLTRLGYSGIPFFMPKSLGVTVFVVLLLSLDSLS